jgi:hypothetical protein
MCHESVFFEVKWNGVETPEQHEPFKPATYSVNLEGSLLQPLLAAIFNHDS